MSHLNYSVNAKIKLGRNAFTLVLALACTLPITANAARASGPMSMPGGPASAVPRLSSAGLSSSGWLSANHSTGAASSASAGNRQSLVGGFNALVHRSTGAAHTQSSSATGGGSFNLSSAQTSFLAGNLGNFSSLTIDVGGHQEVVVAVLARMRIHGCSFKDSLMAVRCGAGRPVRRDSPSA